MLLIESHPVADSPAYAIIGAEAFGEERVSQIRKNRKEKENRKRKIKQTKRDF